MRTLAAVMIGLSALTAATFAGDDGLSPEMRSLVERERAFAKRCRVVGVRASFLEFFADDAIAFTPEPVKYKEAVKGLPPPSDPLAVRLEWAPQTGDVSSSSDLGFTTGPSVRTDTRDSTVPKRFGQFLSVWKRQGDGSWKVAADIGVATPEQVSPLDGPFERFGEPSTPLPADSTRDPLSVDRAFVRHCDSEGVIRGYHSYAGENIRILREKHMTAVGISDAESCVSREIAAAHWSPVSGGMASAGDLCYVYGRYAITPVSGSNLETGSYLHVWKRDRHGIWKLAAEATNPNPPEGAK